MIGTQISHFRILEKLGEGGMGEVYKAHDLDLDRTVALKFLKPMSLSGEAERSRFVREARAAAALDHPNICTVYEIGQAGWRAFIAMAYIAGSSVAELCGAGPLPLANAVDIGAQIAEGLCAAHERGIVHRDIKSANVLVDEKGRAKITDFGLALRSGQSRLTKEGVTPGTSAYMSPEQCRGERVDARTDIWSLGVVLYEMITGRRPFVAAHESALVYSILNVDPEPITSLRSRVPLELERIVEKALAKHQVRRYQHVDELAADLARLRDSLDSSAERLPASAARRAGRRLHSPLPWIAVTAIAAAVAGIIVFYPSQTVPFTERGWMVIADFDNETNEAVLDGVVSEALSIDLQQSKHVNVLSRQRINETLRRMGREDTGALDEDTAREVALREGASAVLAGSVNQVGTSYVLTARIEVPSTGDVVETVRSEAKDSSEVLAAIDDLSRHVRRGLGESRASIWRRDKALEQVTTGSLQALQYYTKAVGLMSTARWDDASRLLHRAIETDSSFAIAYSKLGIIYNNMDDMDRAARYSAMARAREEHVTDRERYYIEARYWEDRGERRLANDDYRLLVQMYPDDFVGHNNLGFSLQYSYEYDEALQQDLAAARLDPDSWYSYHNLSMAYAGLHRYDLAVENAHKAQQINPKGYWSYIVEAWVDCCREDEASGLALLEKLPSDDEGWQSLRLTSLAALYRLFGQDDRALASAREGVSIDALAGRDRAQAWKRMVESFIVRDRGDFDGALFALRKAAALDHSVKTAVYLAAACAAAGHWTAADSVRAAMEGAVDRGKTQTDLSWIERCRGELAMARGSYQAAVESFERSLVLHETLSTRYRLGQALRLNGQYNRAVEQFDLIDEKRFGTFFDNMPWIWPLSYYEKGLACQAAGNRAKAAASFEQFLAFWKDADPGRREVADARSRLESLR